MKPYLRLGDRGFSCTRFCTLWVSVWMIESGSGLLSGLGGEAVYGTEVPVTWGLRAGERWLFSVSLRCSASCNRRIIRIFVHRFLIAFFTETFQKDKVEIRKTEESWNFNLISLYFFISVILTQPVSLSAHSTARTKASLTKHLTKKRHSPESASAGTCNHGWREARRSCVVAPTGLPGRSWTWARLRAPAAFVVSFGRGERWWGYPGGRWSAPW